MRNKLGIELSCPCIGEVQSTLEAMFAMLRKGHLNEHDHCCFVELYNRAYNSLEEIRLIDECLREVIEGLAEGVNELMEKLKQQNVREDRFRREAWFLVSGVDELTKKVRQLEVKVYALGNSLDYACLHIADVEAKLEESARSEGLRQSEDRDVRF